MYLETAEYLVLKSSGEELDRIVDIYLERHPNTLLERYLKKMEKENIAASSDDFKALSDDEIEELQRAFKKTLNRRILRLQETVNEIVGGDKEE